jgi:hypothetical protein
MLRSAEALQVGEGIVQPGGAASRETKVRKHALVDKK